MAFFFSRHKNSAEAIIGLSPDSVDGVRFKFLQTIARRTSRHEAVEMVDHERALGPPPALLCSTKSAPAISAVCVA